VSTTPDLDAKVSTLDVKIDEKVETAVETDPDDAVTATAAIDSAPAAQPAVLPAPVVVPAPLPVPAPETTTPAEPVVDEEVVDVPEEEGEEGAVEVDNPGNKFTPPPILLWGNNNGKRENPWRKAWQDTVKTVTGGGATTPDAGPAPDDNTGDPE
jgi:hypothetical protein